jgi:hypothetical protein
MKMERRDFLKTAILGGLGVAAGATILKPKEAKAAIPGTYRELPWECTIYKGDDALGNLTAYKLDVADILSNNSIMLPPGVPPDKTWIIDRIDGWNERDYDVGVLSHATVPRLNRLQGDNNETLGLIETKYVDGKLEWGNVYSFFFMPLQARMDLEKLFQLSKPRGSEIHIYSYIKDAINNRKDDFYLLLRQLFKGQQKEIRKKPGKWEESVYSISLPVRDMTQKSPIDENKMFVGYFNKKGKAKQIVLTSTQGGMATFVTFFQRYLDDISGFDVLGTPYARVCGHDINILGLPLE